MWKNLNNYINLKEYKEILLEKTKKNQRNKYSRSKSGKYNINGEKIFFRSVWEANYALYLDFLVKHKKIKKWEYEPKTFWFKKIKRGVRSYMPDFKITNNDKSVSYHEVKGWMDNKSKTKLNRMRIYYPNVKIVLIDKNSYKDILKKLKGIINFYY